MVSPEVVASLQLTEDQANRIRTILTPPAAGAKNASTGTSADVAQGVLRKKPDRNKFLEVLSAEQNKTARADNRALSDLSQVRQVGVRRRSCLATASGLMESRRLSLANEAKSSRYTFGPLAASIAYTTCRTIKAGVKSFDHLLLTNLATAELTKGAANAFLATKISFINAMADICATMDGDISLLALSLGLDPRIGKAFLKAGIGYGGACLPKDVRGLEAFAQGIGAHNAALLLSAVDGINVSRSDQVVNLIKEGAGGIEGKRVALWGATFKAGTDDVRESSGLLVADQLHSLGASVTVYDPMGSGNALAAFPELTYADSAIAAAADADAIAVVTAWPEFAQVDAGDVAGVVGGMIMVDACQGIDVNAWREAGWQATSLTAGGLGGGKTTLPQSWDRASQTPTPSLQRSRPQPDVRVDVGLVKFPVRREPEYPPLWTRSDSTQAGMAIRRYR